MSAENRIKQEFIPCDTCKHHPCNCNQASDSILITREQLKGIEFDPDTDTCPVCGEFRSHYTDCWLGKALAGRG